ncbi:MAG: hypothetical protein Q4B52_00190 [Tissierellia bacterium]|nr:hypothetical protein [Tissierellia bacterium]
MEFNLSMEQRNSIYVSNNLKIAFEISSVSSIGLLDMISKLACNNVFVDFNDIEPLISKSSFKQYYNNNNDDYNFIDMIKSPYNLDDYLNMQINIQLSKQDNKIAKYIINRIDDKGILSLPVYDISKKFKTSQKRIRNIIEKIKLLDPKGLASDSIETFLKSQTKNKNLKIIIEKYLYEVKENKIEYIASKLKIDKKEVVFLIENLKKLKPYPLYGYIEGSQNINNIFYDIIVYIRNSKVYYELNIDNNLFCINKNYYNLYLKSNGEVKKYLNKKFKEAMFYKKSLAIRDNNIRIVMDYIITKQKEFFLNNSDLKPMSMKEISKVTNISPATITRIVSNKYLSCKWGDYPLKYFFTAKAVNKNDITDKLIKEKIKKIIVNENKEDPYSDEMIRKILEKDGISITKRTITKYRNNLKIKNFRLRKKY